MTRLHVCESCNIVDDDRNRMRVGYECPICGVPGKGGKIYFHMNVIRLIDLMLAFYKPGQRAALVSNAPKNGVKYESRLAVVIFFCTLGEVLLQHFLQWHMWKLGLPSEIQKRLLDDNPFVKQRIEKLFPTLTGAKWNRAVGNLGTAASVNYAETVAFHKRASEARNEFLHRGEDFAITQEMAEGCMHQVWPLVSLFVDLHNKYVAKRSRNRVSKAPRGDKIP